jgi:DNA replication and repair protein RecF
MGILSRLQVWDFRNLRQVELALGRGTTLLLGRNGQGKSNVIEAVCYLGLLRSYRAQGIGPLIRWGQDSFTVRGELSAGAGEAKGSIAVTQGAKRQLQVDGAAVERGSEFINRFLCVALVPEDVELVKGAAAIRRRFLDIAVTQCQATYLQDLQQYRQALASRNEVLRTPQRYSGAVLAAYEPLLVRHGSCIEAARRRYVRDLCTHLGTLCTGLLGEGHAPVVVSYSSPGLSRDFPEESANCLGEGLQRALERNRERDMREGHTSVGPHRGDMSITLAGRSLAAYGSEGECRLGSLALRLSALAAVRSANHDSRAVVALVDDVTGELDPPRRRAFFRALTPADQVLITATAQPDELAGMVDAAYGVQDGVVLAL